MIRHSGYYDNKKEILNIYNENSIIINDNANPFEIFRTSEFMMGACDIFALCLKETFKYQMCKITEDNKIHYFCIDSSKSEKYYIDVRGFTTSYSEFVSYYSVPSNGNMHTADTNEEKEIKSQDYYIDGKKFAEKIIKNNKNIYDISYSKKL